MAYHYRKRHKRLMAEMNVVPYIDVMLVLLVIFMITSPMMSLTQGVEVELPQVTETGDVPPEKMPVVISVKKDGALFLTYRPQEDEPITLEALVPRVIALHQLEPQRPVLVRGDAGVPYGQVAELMGQLKGTVETGGVGKVGLVVKPVGEAPALPGTAGK